MQELIENNKRYLERKKLYKSLGYDIDAEREFIIQEAGVLSGKILEAGTGKGHFALALAKSGCSFTTFDISPEEQNFAKLNLKFYGFDRKIDFRIENAEKLSFQNGEFDVIFSVNTIHHLVNPYMVIDEFMRILAPKGKLIISDFTNEGFILMDKIHALEGRTHTTGLVTMQEGKIYLSNNGFKVEESNTKYQCVLRAQKG